MSRDPGAQGPDPAAVAGLLRQAGLAATQPDLRQLSGGWNNRVYKLDLPKGPVLLKQYFPDGSGQYPRLAQEFAFCRLAHARVPARAPAALAKADAAGLALFAWVEGRPYDKVTAADAALAADFILSLQAGESGSGTAIGPAAEQCLSLSDHLRHLEARLVRLQSISDPGEAHDQARALVASRLLPLWQQVRQGVLAGLAREPGLDRALDAATLCLSPSDFGFHNALETLTGPVFLDFEYAGWDDPAQLVCDFFAQFEVPAPDQAYDAFAAAIAAQYAEPGWHRARMDLIRPVHLLKWTCIALNHFCPHKGAHRRFARPSEDRLQQQLGKAANLLDRLTASR